MNFFIYILKSSVDGTYYYGQTQDLNSRLALHNSAKVRSTSHKAPWSLFAYKMVATRSEALYLEKKLKNLKFPSRLDHFLLTHSFIIP
jgi:putative endonuclease